MNTPWLTSSSNQGKMNLRQLFSGSFIVGEIPTKKTVIPLFPWKYNIHNI